MDVNELKDIFGDKPISFDDFSKRLAENADKFELANLKTGAYVSKEKFERVERELKGLKAKIESMKNAEAGESKESKDSELAKQVERLTQELEKSKRMKAIESRTIKPEFSDYVYYEVSKQTSEDKPFEKALDEFVKKNPHFVAETKAGKVVKVGSSLKVGSGAATEENINQRMNAAILAAVGRRA